MRVLLVLLLVAMSAFAAEVTLNFDDLTVEQKAKYAAENVEDVTQTAEAVAQSAVDIGESIGTAIGSGLGAVSTELNEFADTKVGMFTAVVIAWKVVGQDAKDLTGGFAYVAVSLPIMGFVLLIWFISYIKVCVPKKIKKENGEVYAVFGCDEEYHHWFVLWHWVGLLVSIFLYAISLSSILC